MKRRKIPAHSNPRPPGKSKTQRRYVLGLMSGTSADGIDAVGVRIEGTGESMRVRFLWHRHTPFKASLRRRLLEVMAPATAATEQLARLHADLGDAFAQAAKKALADLDNRYRPQLIGMAGQTVCHLPNRRAGRTVTLQLGEPARVAAATGITTVADFRQADVAVGGQGAPLVPWTDYILFKNKSMARAVQNIGGIANVTWIPSNAGADDLTAFDTGPGNMIIDALVARVTKGRQKMDRDGRRAARGKVLNQILSQWMKHPYFKRKPPKSTGREIFGRAFLDREMKLLQSTSKSPDDWIATATAFTARSIAQAYRRFLPGFNKTDSNKHHQLDKIEVILCGGGANNPTLMAMLSAELPGTKIQTIQTVGIPAQAKEALSFAVLAAARLDKKHTNLPQVTGARKKALLGNIIEI